MSSSWSSLWRDWDLLRRVAEDFRKLVRELGIDLVENHKVETENDKRRKRAFETIKEKLLADDRPWPDSWNELADQFRLSEMTRRIRYVIVIWQQRTKQVLGDAVKDRAELEAYSRSFNRIIPNAGKWFAEWNRDPESRWFGKVYGNPLTRDKTKRGHLWTDVKRAVRDAFKWEALLSPGRGPMNRNENAPTVEFDAPYEDSAQRASDARDAIESGLHDWVSVFAASSNSTTKHVEAAKELGKAGCHLCRGPIGATGIYPTFVIEPLTKQLDAHEPADCVRIECAISLSRMAKTLLEGHPCPGEDDRGELRMDLFERIYESLFRRASDADRKKTPKRVFNRCILEVRKLDELRQKKLDELRERKPLRQTNS